jgi:hypothetical protein
VFLTKFGDDKKPNVVASVFIFGSSVSQSYKEKIKYLGHFPLFTNENIPRGHSNLSGVSSDGAECFDQSL